MNDTIPKSKITRTISSGRIAVKMGSRHLSHLIKKPFLSKEGQRRSKKKKDMENAKILFNGLSMLRGTALKAAQMLSFESDVIPQSFRKELEKSYNQVPPINRALVRKMIINSFNAPPEEIFETFDLQAFAAASLGQVHRARSKKGETLAVKIQYPDISKTISNDIRLLKTVCRPLPEYAVIKTALDEIEDVLLSETDYDNEGKNIQYFSDNLKNDQVLIPGIFPDLITKNILSMSYMKGQILNEWFETNPDQESRNHIAQILHDIFVEGFYELKRIHADPNPGNFIVTSDLKIGLLDFGCVRKFDDGFIKLYQQLIRIGSGNDTKAYVDLLTQLKLITPSLDPRIRDKMVGLFMQIGDWFSQLFKDETFDFGANPDFMEKGRKIGREMHQFRRYIHNITPEFIFLDRTRYGLIRLFEKMKVKIRIQSDYEQAA